METRDSEPEIESLRRRVAELEDLVAAIRDNRVDAFLVGGETVPRVHVLESVERPFRAMIEEVQQGICTLAEDGRVLFCNLRGAQMLGRVSCDELVGIPFGSLFDPQHGPELEDALQRATEGPAQGRWVTAGGASGALTLDVSIAPLAEGSGATYGVLLTDTSHEAVLRAQTQRTEGFMALVGHELRNPLGAARNALSILKQLASRTEEQRQACEWIERQIDVMTRLIEDLFDVERIAHGKFTLRPEVLDLAAVVRASCQDVARDLAAAGLRLELQLPGEPARIHGDPVRLGQVVANLLQNARKFSDSGGTVRVRVVREGPEWRLHVEDEGVGIAPALLPHVFEPFHQGPPRRGGLGLGLALVRGLAELHGGRVEATSDGEGRGARFTVRLPAMDATTAAPTGTIARL